MNSTRTKVIDLYARVFDKKGSRSCHAILMAELAPGVVAVVDSWNECDAFFETKYWGYVNPILWNTSSLGEIQAVGLGLLPGIGRAPAVRTIQEMVIFGKNQLYSMSHRWHTSPQFFSF